MTKKWTIGHCGITVDTSQPGWSWVWSGLEKNRKYETEKAGEQGAVELNKSKSKINVHIAREKKNKRKDILTSPKMSLFLWQRSNEYCVFAILQWWILVSNWSCFSSSVSQKSNIFQSHKPILHKGLKTGVNPWYYVCILSFLLL